MDISVIVLLVTSMHHNTSLSLLWFSSLFFFICCFRVPCILSLSTGLKDIYTHVILSHTFNFLHFQPPLLSLLLWFPSLSVSAGATMLSNQHLRMWNFFYLKMKQNKPLLVVEHLFICLLVIHISLVKYSNLVSLLNFKSSLHTFIFPLKKKFGCTGSYLWHAMSSFLTRDWAWASCIGSVES